MRGGENDQAQKRKEWVVEREKERGRKGGEPTSKKRKQATK